MAFAAMPASAAAQSQPDVTRAPSVTGLAQVGQTLQAQGATWIGRQPLTVTYFWLQCPVDDDSLWGCRFADGANGSSYVVTAADLGKRLRAVVRVENRDGRDYGVSALTAAVTAAPPPSSPPPPPPPPAPPPPPPPSLEPTPQPVAPEPAAAPVASPRPPAAAVQPRMMRPAPLVRIAGWLTDRGAMLTRLSVRAPRGATISVRCSGASCPRETLARTTPPSRVVAARPKLTRLRAFERRLRAGTRLVIRVTRKGFIGKYTVIRIRRGEQPFRRDLCLYPGSKAPAKCPGG